MQAERRAYDAKSVGIGMFGAAAGFAFMMFGSATRPEHLRFVFCG